jgi:hypothetical protein
MGNEFSIYCLIKKNTIGAAIDGIIKGIKLSIRSIFLTRLTNPNAETWLGTIIIIRINVKMAFLPLKLYACMAYAVIVEK